MIHRSLTFIVRSGVLGCVLFAMSGGSAWADKPVLNAPTPVPEIDAGSAVAALTVLSGGLLLITDRFRKFRSSH
jgi:hypothetical protein